MDYKAEVFMVQYPLVTRFVYHAVYYRELHLAYCSASLESEFWTHTIDAHILQSVVYWCMVFGKQGCNRTHWKHLSETESESLQCSFRRRLFEETDLSPERWTEYWQSITKFRNEYAAHRELQIKCKVPKLDTALNVAYFYDRWIREVISPDVFDDPYLQELATALIKKIKPLIESLIQVTKTYNQETKPFA